MGGAVRQYVGAPEAGASVRQCVSASVRPWPKNRPGCLSCSWSWSSVFSVPLWYNSGRW